MSTEQTFEMRLGKLKEYWNKKVLGELNNVASLQSGSKTSLRECAGRNDKA